MRQPRTPPPVGADRRGYVLIAVLWTTVAVAACALTAAVAGRDAVAAAANRVALTRAAWRAEGCAARTLAAVDAALTAAATTASDGGVASGSVWRTLDQRVDQRVDQRAGTAPIGGEDLACRIDWRSSGTTVDLNTADRPTLTRLFAAFDIPGPRADSMVDTLLTRRDPRTGGRPFTAAPELARVPGFTAASLDAIAPALDRAFGAAVGVDSARVDVLHAPVPVLASLPGMTAEAVEVLRAVRRGSEVGPDVRDLNGLLAHLSPSARTALLAQAPDVAARTTFDPEAWVLTARASSGPPVAGPRLAGAPAAGALGVTAVLELRLAHAGARLAVVRRRTWVE